METIPFLRQSLRNMFREHIVDDTYMQKYMKKYNKEHPHLMAGYCEICQKTVSNTSLHNIRKYHIKKLSLLNV